MNRPTALRSLTDAMRTWDADDFATLLVARPDLCTPAPRSFAELVRRLGTGGSTLHALHRLNTWQHVVAEALAALPDGAAARDVEHLINTDDQLAVRRGLADLRARALLWGPDSELHLVAPARTALGPWPGGLADPSSRPMTSREITAALAGAGESVRPLLDQLVWGPPTGKVRDADRPITPETARTPMELSLAHGLLRPLDRDTVVMPREVALHLREGRLLADMPSPTPPELDTGHRRRPDLITRAGVGAAITLVADLEQMVSALQDIDVALLRDGGVSVKDLNAMISVLRLPGSHPMEARTYAGLLVELAWAVGLVNQVNSETLLPTPRFDQWLTEPAARRWREIVTAWLATPRWFAWSVQPRPQETKPHPLGPDADWRGAPDLRAELLDLVVGPEPGTTLSPARLARAYAWRRPALAGQLEVEAMCAQFWAEAGWLGLQGMDAVTRLAGLAADPQADMPEAVAEEFPAPVTDLIIQSDLTAVAAGPLEFEVGRTIRLLATQESRGAGGVFRFSEASLRRAFDAGWTSADVTSWLAEHSTTGIPQPLEYLVADVARLHGQIKVGAVSSWVQTDDEAIIARILAYPEASAWGLRQLAPGVLVSDAEPEEMVALLHEMHLSPTAQDAQGNLLTAPRSLRARNRQLPPAPGPPDATMVAMFAEQIAASLQ